MMIGRVEFIGKVKDLVDGSIDRMVGAGEEAHGRSLPRRPIYQGMLETAESVGVGIEPYKGKAGAAEITLKGLYLPAPNKNTANLA